jgi:4,5-DOPA dioxygenase extradiol
VISAHWLSSNTLVTSHQHPPTIHDFGGFPQALFDFQYPAPGDPALARQIVELLGQERCTQTETWGLDHGAWTILCHLFPAADVPVVQISLGRRLDLGQMIEIGRALAPLRSEGVLIIGSGNVVHNLNDAFGRMQTGESATPEWASRFDNRVAEALLQRDDRLLTTVVKSSEGRFAHPTPDHYWPLLYTFGVSDYHDVLDFPIIGFDAGSLSMRSIRWTWKV